MEATNLLICQKSDTCVGYCDHKYPHVEKESCSTVNCISEKKKCVCIIHGKDKI